MYLIDYHVHTKRCGHARGEDREYIEKAIQRGLKEIGFSDHVPRFYHPDENVPVVERGMSWSDLDQYVGTIAGLRAEYPEIKVKLGLEIDYLPGWENEIQKTINDYPWDYVIGSVHFLPEWNYGYIGFEKTRGPEEIYPAYFNQVVRAAESQLYDFLGHIDLPRRFFRSLPEEAMSALYQDLAQRLGKCGAAIELNTYAIRSAKQENVGVLPEEELLGYCRCYGVNVTMGSDAHKPDEVAADFDKAADLLTRVGYDKIAVFNRRKAELIDWN